MAIYNESISHEMIDGGVATELAEQHKVQSVPAVFHQGQMIHSGRGALVDLIDKLGDGQKSRKQRIALLLRLM